MARSRFLPVLSAVAALAACEAPAPQGVVSRLSLDERSQVITYAFGGRCSGSIGSGYRKSVSKFLHQNADPATDIVIISVPRGCNAHADRAREQAARTMVSTWAGPVKVENGRPGDPQSIRGIVKIAHVEGIRVDEGACHERLGCANASNLAAMMDDPRDLYYADGMQRYRDRSDAAATAN